jgi:hypothetical protein
VALIVDSLGGLLLYDEEMESSRHLCLIPVPETHVHRTIEAAAACIAKDMEGCKKQGGYSDRVPRYANGAELGEQMWHTFQYHLENQR